MLKKIVMLLALVFLLVPSVAFAKSSYRPTQIVTLPKDEVVNSDYFAAGEVVEISGTVNGDVYAAGGTVLVDGVVNGDLIVAGGTVTVSGRVAQDVRAAGGQVTLLGMVGRNATLLGGNVELTDTATIAGSLTTAAGNVAVNSPVGSIEAAAGNIRLSAKAKVAGPVNYMSEEEISVSETASVSGEVNRRTTPEFMREPSKEDVDNFFKSFDVFAGLASLLSSLILGLLLIKFYPNYAKNASDILTNRFLPSMGIGFLGLVAVPIFIIALMLTLVGIPLALFLAVAFVIYLYLTRLYAMLAIGAKVVELTKVKASMYLVFVVGLIVYYVLSIIPVIGGLVKLVVLIASFGAALQNERATWLAARKAKVI